MQAFTIFSSGRRGAAKLTALVSAALLAGGCSGTEAGNASRDTAAANQAVPAAAPASDPAPAVLRGAANAQAQAPADAAAEPGGKEQERRGRTRKARCRIDNEPERACDFTPVLRDGSFDIEMPDRQLRLIVNGDEAAPFELIGTRRIPIAGLLRRDPADRACWVGEEPGLGLQRVCAR